MNMSMMIVIVMIIVIVIMMNILSSVNEELLSCISNGYDYENEYDDSDSDDNNEDDKNDYIFYVD